MYGGVAATYILWKLEGEPYKKGTALYVKVTHPITKAAKEVRFYTDKKHADAMPANKNTPKNSLCKTFGFESEEDYILCIKERDITEEEKENFFAYKWRFGMFFGGIWYSPKTAEIPAIKNVGKVFKTTWPEFRAAGQKHSKELGLIPESESCWFK